MKTKGWLILTLIAAFIFTPIDGESQRKKEKDENDAPKEWEFDKSMIGMLGFRSIGPDAK